MKSILDKVVNNENPINRVYGHLRWAHTHTHHTCTKQRMKNRILQMVKCDCALLARDSMRDNWRTDDRAPVHCIDGADVPCGRYSKSVTIRISAHIYDYSCFYHQAFKAIKMCRSLSDFQRKINVHWSRQLLLTERNTQSTVWYGMDGCIRARHI